MSLLPVACFSLLSALAQEHANAQRMRGQVVCDQLGSPIQGAEVIPSGMLIGREDALTDTAGAFEMRGSPRCHRPFSPREVRFDYLRVSAPDPAVAFVAPCSTAPWANPVRLRPGATLVGDFGCGRKGRLVRVRARGAEPCWPPCSGLSVDDEERRSQTDGSGRFELVHCSTLRRYSRMQMGRSDHPPEDPLLG
jgi:hypothetical protein